MQLIGRERKMWTNANLASRVMWPLYQESMYHCGEAISNARGLESSSEGASPFVMRDRCQWESSLQPVIEINIKLLWLLQSSRHGQTGFLGQLFHILYQSKQLDIPPSSCPLRKRHDVTPKREITGVSKHPYHPFSEELASEIFQCLHQHELA